MSIIQSVILTHDLHDFSVPFAYLVSGEDLSQLCVEGEPDLLDQGFRLATYPNTGYTFITRVTKMSHYVGSLEFKIVETFELDQRVTAEGAITASVGAYRGAYFTRSENVSGGAFINP